MTARKKTTADILGWREWIAIPELGVKKIKVKVDTGARTSALHAEKIEIFKRGRKRYVRFVIHPNQDTKKPAIKAEAPLIEKRSVKSSVGTETVRPVIEVDIKIDGKLFPIELTLVNRDVMGFRMLLGRQAIRKEFLVDPGRSFLKSPAKKK